MSARVGPGIAKVRRVRLVRRQNVELVALAEGPIASLLEHADAVSEGATDRTGGRYFGTTDLLLDVPEDERAVVAAALGQDPHARVRALRIARREAALRCAAPLGTMQAEVVVVASVRGVRVHVDVDVEVLGTRASAGPLNAA